MTYTLTVEVEGEDLPEIAAKLDDIKRAVLGGNLAGDGFDIATVED